MNWSVVGIVAAVAANALTFLVARRKSSGRVVTTEAEELWQESSSIRKELREEINLMRSELQTVRRENLMQAEQILKLKADHEDCENRYLVLSLQLAEMKGEG